MNAAVLTDKGQTARIEIYLKKDAAYEVSREGTDLKISFKKSSAAMASAEQPVTSEDQKPVAKSEDAVAEKSVLAATRLESISTTELENGINISVNAGGAINEYKSFSTSNPPRIVFDLFNIQSPYKTEQTVPIESKWVKRLRHYAYPDRLRVVLDTVERYLSDFSARPSDNGLLIQVGTKSETAVMPVQAKMPAETLTGEMMGTQANNAKPAWVNRIDFSSEAAGKSTIVIGTTAAVKYNLKKIDDKKLLLNLYNTNIPEYRRRPLITTRFESAVDRITPFQTPAAKNTSMVAIELRESVAYAIEQTNDLLMIHFEASSVPPQAVDEAQLPPWKKVIAQAIAETTDAEPEAVAGVVSQPQPTGKFTGEKIALNFYNTDVKNVFRILMDVSQKNFAIDKDVTGTVTLTFDKPVPWDQVLDLILKMNQLGMVYEGDIIRIATLSALEKEVISRQAMVAADQKFEDQKMALEPLVTEYIPVSYANASSDILPHIVLTEGRGKVTVDARNNQIILTDIPSKIAHAKETIRKIDKVTPQVLIEARIIEANTDFQRDFGTAWSLAQGPYANNSWLGGDLSLAMGSSNPPNINYGQLGLTFTRILGTAAVLDAAIAAGESNGDVKILASPKILTLDNTPAEISQGQAYPIVTVDEAGNSVPEFKEIVLKLTVTPHVTPDNRISMDIAVSDDEIGNVINNQISINTKKAKTKLLVNDGETITIAGIKKRSTFDLETKVPGLGDIPIIGWMFKNTIKKDTVSELLIFITPRVIRLEQRPTS